MAQFEYGPVELYVVGFEGSRPDDATFAELARLIDDETVRLLDLVILTHEEDGGLTVVELEDLGGEFDVEAFSVPASGLVGQDDLEELADAVPLGGSAAVVAVELLWAKDLASRLAASGGVVLATERIPAPAVNALLEEIGEES
ncbi:DUF6325 family protein [Rathayibacter sp. YIM 133350]|uniref:DUF6325 family protein n=1 Tax=Rathayibacter sp. YIM 133350 TaxID=3131992 RepID=UPI00307D871A